MMMLTIGRLKIHDMQKETISKGEWIRPLLQMIRWPNLVIIILTQVLLRYCIFQHLLYQGQSENLSPFPDFLLLLLATVLIAIGGYVINDYYDVKIDRINHPGKHIITGFISYRGAVGIHLSLNILAIFIGFILAYRIRVFAFGLIFPLIAGLLWLYSARLKRMAFWGNILVSMLSSLVILIVWLYDFYFLSLDPELFFNYRPYQIGVLRLTLAYALFAFLVSFFREIIKDMEDQEGDQALGCRTLPIVFGTEITRWMVIFIILVTFLLMGSVLWILFQMELQILFWYFLVMIQFPLLLLAFMTAFARSKREFYRMSQLSKLIMLNGILSMLLFMLIK